MPMVRTTHGIDASGDGFVHVGIQMGEDLDELFLMPRLLVANPLYQRLERGIIEEYDLLTVAFVEVPFVLQDA
jgi:hypothetical protein